MFSDISSIHGSSADGHGDSGTDGGSYRGKERERAKGEREKREWGGERGRGERERESCVSGEF